MDETRIAPGKFDLSGGNIDDFGGYIKLYWGPSPIYLMSANDEYVVDISGKVEINKKTVHYLQLKHRLGWQGWRKKDVDNS